MVDFDRYEPTLDDIKHSWKVKLAVALVIIGAIGTMVVLDILGHVGKWG